MTNDASMLETYSAGNLPDLPSLESVETTTQGSRGIVLFAAIMLALLAAGIGTVVLVLLAKNGILPCGAWLVIPPVVLAALVLLLVLRYDSSYYRWSTDASGLNASGMCKTTTVPWTEVEGVELVGKGSSLWGCVIKTGKRKLVLVGGPTDDIALLASVWQHLRRHGKVDDSKLDRRARGFWVPIPNWIPKDLDWHNPKSPSMPSLVVTLLAAILLAAAFYCIVTFRIIREWGSWWHVIQAVPLRLLEEFRRRLNTVQHLSIRADRIEARTARKSIVVLRDQVQATTWTPHGHTIVCRKPTSRIVIPYQKDDHENVSAHLALIRWLRQSEQPKPVLVPNELLEACPSPTPKPLPERVELPAPRVATITLAAIGLLALPLVFWVIGTNLLPRSLGIYLIVSAAVAPLLAIRLGTSRWIADAAGITVKSLRRARLIRWDQVASYIVKPDWTAKTRRILKSTTGTTLLDSRSVSAGGSDAEEFWAYADQKLQHVRRDG